MNLILLTCTEFKYHRVNLQIIFFIISHFISVLIVSPHQPHGCHFCNLHHWIKWLIKKNCMNKSKTKNKKSSFLVVNSTWDQTKIESCRDRKYRKGKLQEISVQKSTLTRAVIFSRFSTISQINVVSQSTIGQYLPKQIVTVDTERPVFMPNSWWENVFFDKSW